MTPTWVLLPVLVVGLAVLATATAGASARLGGATVLAPLHEGARLLVQRRRTTVAPDSLLWRVAGGSLPVIALLMLAVVPVGGAVLADLPVGVVWFNAMDVLVWASLWLLGWGSNALGPLVGGYRFLAQALAYELPLMFALTTPAVAASSLRVGDVVASQGVWNVLTMPVAAAVYLLCVLGFAFLGPLGQPAATDLGGGVTDELSGPDRLVVVAGRWALLTAGAAFFVPMFLGGGGALALLAKTAVVLVALVLVGTRLPLVRTEKLMEVGWLVLLPLTLVQLLATSLVVVL